MTPLVWRKKYRYFSTTSMLCMLPSFWLSIIIAQEANKLLQGGVSLPFIGSLRVTENQTLLVFQRKMKVLNEVYFTEIWVIIIIIIIK